MLLDAAGVDGGLIEETKRKPEPRRVLAVRGGWWGRLMSAIGIGDLKILLSQYFASVGAVEFSGAVQPSTDFGVFTASISGNVSILVALDDTMGHLTLADKTLDGLYRGVDEGRQFPPKQWQIFKSVVVAGHQYAFQFSVASASLALVVVYNPLAT